MADFSDSRNQNVKDLPTETKSKRLMAKDAEKALLTLKIMGAPDEIIDALGLRPHVKG